MSMGRREKKMGLLPIYINKCDRDLFATFSDQITIRSRPDKKILILIKITKRDLDHDISITHFNALVMFF